MRRTFSFATDEYYHIYNRGTDKRTIFIEPHDYNRFIVLLHLCNNKDPIDIDKLLRGGRTFPDLIDLEIKERLVNIGAYCLMPNHVHFCIKIRDENILKQVYLEKQFEKHRNIEPSQGSKPCEGFRDSKHLTLWLSQQFSHLFNSYTQAFNKQQNRQGSLFRSRFHKKAIQDETYLLTVIRYIHQNPLAHGFVSTLTDWQFSSYNTFLLPKETLVAKDAVLPAFGDLNNFVEIHKEPVNLKDWF